MCLRFHHVLRRPLHVCCLSRALLQLALHGLENETRLLGTDISKGKCGALSNVDT